MTELTQPPRTGFSDVDAEPDPRGYIHMLDLQHADPFKQRLKARCRELLALRPGLRVLDAGAGSGWMQSRSPARWSLAAR